MILNIDELGLISLSLEILCINVWIQLKIFHIYQKDKCINAETHAKLFYIEKYFFRNDNILYNLDNFFSE